MMSCRTILALQLWLPQGFISHALGFQLGSIRIMGHISFQRNTRHLLRRTVSPIPHFHHIISRGNGCAEAAVKVCKNMLKKCDDPDLAMLMYRNTPQQGYTYSPAQRMFSRHTCTTLSVGVSGLSPTTVDPSVARQDLSSRRPAPEALL